MNEEHYFLLSLLGEFRKIMYFNIGLPSFKVFVTGNGIWMSLISNTSTKLCVAEIGLQTLSFYIQT